MNAPIFKLSSIQSAKNNLKNWSRNKILLVKFKNIQHFAFIERKRHQLQSPPTETKSIQHYKSSPQTLTDTLKSDKLREATFAAKPETSVPFLSHLPHLLDLIQWQNIQPQKLR